MSVILFDGVCNLCNAIVQFIIKRDKLNKFQFTSLQSKYGIEFTRHFQLHPVPYESIILYEEGKVYFKSEAVIRILTSFGGVWKTITILKIIPKFVSDFIYDMIAKSRYKVFGKKETCMVPAPELKEKFLDQSDFHP
ncbi:MAG: thiol-disulfide oxidoreductase DCC family protein [Chitinophagales bacterium]